MEWKVEVDEAMFLGDLEKSHFLPEFEPYFFFDDQTITIGVSFAFASNPKWSESFDFPAA